MDWLIVDMLERIVRTLPRLLALVFRRMWLVALVTVTVCAALTARAVAAYVEADYLAPSTHRALQAKVADPATAPQHKRPDGSGLVDRNMFCSSCGPIAETGPAGATYAGTPAILIATSVGDEARATVRVPSTEVQGSWALGETIPGVGTIDRIGYTSIDVVDTTGKRGKISLLDVMPAAGTAVASAATPATPPPPWADRIHKVDDTSYEVERSLVKELVSGASKANGVRALPAMKNGEIVGMRFAGVSAGSMAAAIGLKSGDVMSAIDGKEIKTAQALLDVYAGLDSMNQVQLEGTRGGKPLAIKLYLR